MGYVGSPVTMNLGRTCAAAAVSDCAAAWPPQAHCAHHASYHTLALPATWESSAEQRYRHHESTGNAGTIVDSHPTTEVAPVEPSVDRPPAPYRCGFNRRPGRSDTRLHPDSRNAMFWCGTLDAIGDQEIHMDAGRRLCMLLTLIGCGTEVPIAVSCAPIQSTLRFCQG